MAGKEWPTGEEWRVRDTFKPTDAVWEPNDGPGWSVRCFLSTDDQRFVESGTAQVLSKAERDAFETANDWADRRGEFADEPKWPTPVMEGPWRKVVTYPHRACVRCGRRLKEGCTDKETYWYSPDDHTRMCCECFEEVREDKEPEPEPEPEPTPKRIVLAEGVAQLSDSPAYVHVGRELVCLRNARVTAQDLAGTDVRLVIEVLSQQPCPTCKGKGTVPVEDA